MTHEKARELLCVLADFGGFYFRYGQQANQPIAFEATLIDLLATLRPTQLGGGIGKAVRPGHRC